MGRRREQLHQVRKVKKSNAVIGAVAAVVVLLASCIIGLPLMFFMAQQAKASCGGAAALPADAGPAFDAWNVRQVTNAAVIVSTGRQLKVPPRGFVIALATAMQESHLKVYANDNDEYPKVKRISMALPHEAVGHDHDSVGLFQQRPKEGAGGWGFVHELMNPAISATKFYNALLKVDGWEKMRLTDAAQAVQRSGFPEAYQDWEDEAELLAAKVLGLPNIDSIGGGPPGAECGIVDDGNFVVSASGWTKPVTASVGAPWGQNRGDHIHAGVDLIGKRNAAIRAAAAGKVVVSKCNAPAWHGCDKDGYPGLGGCGWYVEIKHAGNIHTRYCHMTSQPLVAVGDTVAVGEVLGSLGSSGNSSGPHLHYEVHTNVPDGSTGTSGNSIDPVPFMEAQGAPLG
jgi:murein DD-endopeptidase MepM/ murein hydrolase activator NlpD